MSPAPIGMVQYGCGLCCHKEFPCEKCLVNTLKANGLSVDLVGRLRGLKSKSPGHGGHDAVHFSEMTTELRKLCREAREGTT
jgi:hypothetical protein